jgi:hypothetical protein
MKSGRSAEFVRNMTAEAEAEPPASITPRSSGGRRKAAQQPATSSRAGLKHFGGYLDDATLEKIALLRVRLKKDNSELIKLAIDELYAKNHAKRAFGDA